MRLARLLTSCWVAWLSCSFAPANAAKVYVIPIQSEIATPLTYLVRRGVKQAIEDKASLLVLDMDTNGGRLDATEEIIKALSRFKGETVTYVNTKAFSAGAFVAVSTEKIFMAPQSVIGAATPIMMSPGGGVEGMPESVEAKMTSAVRALVRTSAEKNGYNIEVIDAMIDRNRQVEMDGSVISEKGELLTLTNVQAEKKYGTPPLPLLSSGTYESLDALLAHLGYADAKVVRLDATGAEQLAGWLTTLSPLLLLVGIIGVYIEMKTPGFGLPGIVGIIAFALYFAGGYIAGLSGWEWTVVFFVGLALVLAEIFVFPGTLVVGLIGGIAMLVALVMAMVDLYPGMPAVPSMGLIQDSLLNVLISSSVALVIMILLSRFLLKTPLIHRLIDPGASGSVSVARMALEQSSQIGEIGLAVSPLRPGGKAQFGPKLLDVITRGEFIERGRMVRILSFSGHEAVVELTEPVEEPTAARYE